MVNPLRSFVALVLATTGLSPAVAQLPGAPEPDAADLPLLPPPAPSSAMAVPSHADATGRLADIDCIAKAIGYEAGNEPEAGQQAIAQVILNRVHHPAFPKSVCGVVFQGSDRRTGCQFTFTCDGAMHRALSRRTWDAALRIATAAVDGQLPPTIGSATHYHADYVAPRWAPELIRVGSIGAHIFYRPPLAAAGDVGDAVRHGSSASTVRPAAVAFSVWGLTAATLANRGGHVVVRSE